MDVSQWAIDLKLAPDERDRLEGLVRNGNTPQKLVAREPRRVSRRPVWLNFRHLDGRDLSAWRVRRRCTHP